MHFAVIVDSIAHSVFIFVYSFVLILTEINNSAFAAFAQLCIY